MPFSKLRVEKIGFVDNKAIWMLLEPLIWENGIIRIETPAFFQSDFSSIPQAALSILGSIGQESGITHDYGYRDGAFMMVCGYDFPVPIDNRWWVDTMYKTWLAEEGIEEWKRDAMYKALRVGAGAHWKKRTVMEQFMEGYKW